MRKTKFGSVSGGANTTNPEKYQIQSIGRGTSVACSKSRGIRINLRTHNLCDAHHPNTKEDGFDYSEDFDAVQHVGDKRILINLKCIVGEGGSQTRSLREVYWFVKGELSLLLANPEQLSRIFFANVLDGDEANSAMDKFAYLLSRDEYANVRKNVYVGDLRGYFVWFNSILSP